jgi:hypothetical protein
VYHVYSFVFFPLPGVSDSLAFLAGVFVVSLVSLVSFIGFFCVLGGFKRNEVLFMFHFVRKLIF